MTTSPVPKKTIGRADIIGFPELGIGSVHSRIDTGARTSAIWVSHVVKEGDVLAVTFFGKGNQAYTGKPVYFHSFTQELVTSSNGHTELRYKIRLLVLVRGRKIRAGFTLADRSKQVYPVLIGRNVLRGKFIVDVKLGKPLVEAEKKLLQKKRDIKSKGSA